MTDFILSPYSVSEDIVEILVNDNNYSETFLLNRNIIIKLKNNLAIELFTTQDQNKNIYDFSEKKLGWFLPPSNTFKEYLSISLTFEINFQNSMKKLEKSILNINHRINKTRFVFMEGIENIVLHSQPIPHYQELSQTMSKSKPLSENYTVIVSKTCEDIFGASVWKLQLL